MAMTPVVHLIKELLERECEVTVFTLDPEVQDEVILKGDHLQFCIGPYRKHGRARDFFRVEQDYLRNAILRENPDIVHAHWTYEFAQSALDSGIPTLVTAHDVPLILLQYDSSPYRIMRTFMTWKVIRSAKFMTGVSPHVVDHIKRWFNYKNHIQVVPNGLPDQIFLNKNTRSDSLQLQSKTIFASVLTGWGKNKNGPALIRAFNLLRKQKPLAELWMFGAGFGKGEEAEIWASQKGLGDGINYIGEVTFDTLIHRLAAEVDILVHPAFEESFGMSVVEAMAVGLPVIGGKSSGGIPFILNYGKAGILTDVHHPKAIFSAMDLLATNDDLRKKVALHGNQYAFENFTITKVADQYQTIYARILHQPG